MIEEVIEPPSHPTFDQRNRVIRRREESCACGGVKRTYTVERRDGSSAETWLHACQHTLSQGLNGLPIRKMVV